jgi:xanthine dehydrogenase iron-sulfur cluster and FAD-binding subunit A
MSAAALLRRPGVPKEAEVRTALAGNLCRCTGYVKIVEAVRDAARGGSAPPARARLTPKKAAAAPPRGKPAAKKAASKKALKKSVRSTTGRPRAATRRGRRA